MTSGSKRQKPRATETKRKQFVACDACRLRRVRCIRTAEAADCEGCLARHFRCTTYYVTQQATKQANSGRLGQTKRLYGKALDVVAYDSPESRLGKVQSDSYLANVLVQDYRTALLANTPLVPDFDRLLLLWEANGRRYDQLESTSDKALLALVLALASRVTSVPVIAGQEAPDPLQIRIAPQHCDAVSLHTFGLNRDSVCRDIEAEAAKMVSCFMEQPASFESICALVTMQTIVDTRDPLVRNRGARIYSAAAIEQLRALVALGEYDETIMAPRVRAIVAADTMCGFEAGRALQITDDDVFSLLPGALVTEPSEVLEAVARLPTSQSYGMLVEAACIMSRCMKRKLCCPLHRARFGLPDIDFFELQKGQYMTLLSACDLFFSRCHHYRELQSVRAVQQGLCLQLMVLGRVCATRDGPQFTTCAQSIQSIVVQAMLEFSRTAEQLLQDGMLLGNGLIWAATMEVADYLLDQQWCTAHVQASDALMKCARQIAFSWPNAGLDAIRMEEVEVRLKRAQEATALDWLLEV